MQSVGNVICCNSNYFPDLKAKNITRTVSLDYIFLKVAVVDTSLLQSNGLILHPF
jgi:hypothetical protein